MPQTIALVDDDSNLLTTVAMGLTAAGFTVDTYSDGLAALDGLSRKPADLAVLDIKMPNIDGMEVLDRLRRHSDMPVIFLTSKSEEPDQILGLSKGADDYITKPFSQRLLIERIRAVLRRRAPGREEEDDANLQRGELMLEPARHKCLWRGVEVHLTVTEFLLLEALARRPGHVKSRDQLIDAAYGEHLYVDDRTIDSHVKRIRRKLRQADPEFAHIETLYGIGYRYRDD